MSAVLLMYDVCMHVLFSILKKDNEISISMRDM